MIIKSNNESSTKKTVGSDGGPPVAAKPPVSHIPGSQSNHFSHDEESGPHTPQYTRQSSQDSDAQASHKMSRQTSAKDRVRDRGRKFNKGYRVLAEVTPNLGISSRGSKLFMKQRHRMQNFVTEGDTNNEDQRTQFLGNSSDASEGVSDTWATPWNMASKSSSSIQYIPAKKLAGEFNEMPTDRQKDPLGFLPRPPDFWRAKVEQNYPDNGPTPLYRLRSRSVGRHMKVSSDPSAYANFVKRPDSAPMVEPLEYSQAYGEMYPRDAANGENQENNIYTAPPRPASATLPTFHFNAKRYYTSADRHQGLRSRNTFKATPYVYRDFNAVPKGWHRKY